MIFKQQKKIRTLQGLYVYIKFSPENFYKLGNHFYVLCQITLNLEAFFIFL